jgi:hypothetical protein
VIGRCSFIPNPGDFAFGYEQISDFVYSLTGVEDMAAAY